MTCLLFSMHIVHHTSLEIQMSYRGTPSIPLAQVIAMKITIVSLVEDFVSLLDNT